MALEIETKFFDQHRQQWLSEGRQGQWAVVRGDELLGFYPHFSQAYTAGVRKFGNVTFLVKEITPAERVETIHRVCWGQRESKRAG